MRVIYIGPNLPSRGLQKFTVHSQTPSGAIGAKELEALCVPVAGFRRARAALKLEGSEQWSAYRAALAAFRPNKKRGDQ